MKYLIQIAICCIVLSTHIKSHAQETANEVMIVYLKDGSQLEGYIQKWDYETSLFLKTTGGSIFEFPADKIDHVIQKSLIEINTKTEVYNFNETGQYYHWRVQALVGNDGNRANNTPGYGFAFSTGYRLNRFIGAGIGVGYDKFIDDSGEEVIPIFAEFTGYAVPKTTSFSYSLGLGYSFARDNSDYGIVDSKGGMLIYPAIGVRFGSGKLKYTMDLGYKFQKATFTYLNPWDNSTRSEQRLTYKRLTLRFGILI